MAETSEIAAGAGAIGAFLGGLWAALKWRKPSGDDEKMLALRVDEIERRVKVLEESAARDREEMQKTLSNIWGKVNAAATDAAVCRAILDDRKKQI